jgi:hypothetical protein
MVSDDSEEENMPNDNRKRTFDHSIAARDSRQDSRQDNRQQVNRREDRRNDHRDDHRNDKDDTSSGICIFHTRGVCLKGDECNFTHEDKLKTRTDKKPRPNTPKANNQKPQVEECRNFARGTCTRGNACPYKHPDTNTKKDKKDKEREDSQECKSCAAPGHSYGPKCSNYAGCRRCEDKTHMARDCDNNCIECGAPGHTPCMDDCKLRKMATFRLGLNRKQRT